MGGKIVSEINLIFLSISRDLFEFQNELYSDT